MKGRIDCRSNSTELCIAQRGERVVCPYKGGAIFDGECGSGCVDTGGAVRYQGIIIDTWRRKSRSIT